MRYTYMWEFMVGAEHRAQFEAVYGPKGEWVALFRRSFGYVGTQLLRDATRPGRFLTIDRWESEQAYRAFRASFAREYAELDQRCEHLTESENSLGSFTEPDA